MANLAVIFTFLFSLFALSHARDLLTQPSNIVAEDTPSNNKETKTNLPSRDSSETDFIKVFHLPVSNIPISKNTDTLARIGTVRPFTVTYEISLHPINRHFQDNNINVNDPFMFKFPHRRHRCHNHGKKSVGPREVSYGNDMIMGHESEVNAAELTDESKEEGRVEGGGFWNKVRKFLNQF